MKCVIKFLLNRFVFVILFVLAYIRRNKKQKPANDKIVWFGAYGNSNKGDDFIFWALKKFIPLKYDISLSCRDIRFKNNYGVMTFDKGENVFSVLRNIKLIRDSSFFILGGGGLLESYDDSEDSQRLKMTYIAPFLLAKIFGLRILILGIGCNKVHSQNIMLEKAIGFMFSYSDVIVTRDKKSLTGFKECSKIANINAHWTFDPVFTLPSRISKKDKLVSFLLWPYYLWPEFYRDDALKHINDVKKKNHNLFLENIRKSIYEVIRKGYKPIFPVFHFSDRIFLSELGVDCSECDKDEYMEIIGKSSLVVTMRYHGQITSLLNHTPIISLSVQEKMREMVKNLNVECFSFSHLEEFNDQKFSNMFDIAIKQDWNPIFQSFEQKKAETADAYLDYVYNYLNKFCV